MFTGYKIRLIKIILTTIHSLTIITITFNGRVPITETIAKQLIIVGQL